MIKVIINIIKKINPVIICCTCTFVCIVTSIYIRFIYRSNIDRTELANFWLNLITSLGPLVSTIGAFIIAIKTPYWNKEANKTELKVYLENQFPYRTKTITKEQVKFSSLAPMNTAGHLLSTYSGNTELKYYTFFYRLKVENVSNNIATNVQIYLEHLRKKGKTQDLDNFLPMYLKWSYTHELQSNKIIKGMGRYCDFFYIRKGEGFLQFTCEDNMATNNTTNNTIKEPGDYEIIIIIGAENSKKLKRYAINFSYNNKWLESDENDEPDKIISGIKIKENRF